MAENLYGDALYGDSRSDTALVPIRQQIIDALAAQLATITVDNGYQGDLGLHLSEWETVPMDPAVESFRLEYRDADESQEYAAVGEHLHKLVVELRIVLADAAPLLAMRKMIADVTVAIGVDVSWGGLAQDTQQDGNWVVDKGQAADTVSGARVKYVIEYTTEPWNPYQ